MICQHCDDFREREKHQGQAEELQVLLTSGEVSSWMASRRTTGSQARQVWKDKVPFCVEGRRYFVERV